MTDPGPQPPAGDEAPVSRHAATRPLPGASDAPPEAPAPAPLTGTLEPGQRIGPYTIAGEIGRGGMAIVYRARRDGMGRDVALKVIRPDQAASAEGLARFRREAQVASALTDHPGIVGAHDIGESGGMLYLAMDLVEGRPLHALVEDELPAERAARFVEAAARAVHFAHTRGVLHRDIKPANILVTTDGEVRLTDFGIARLQDSAPDRTQLTRAGSVIGSPDYMSPEQATGAPIDARSDVYSLGATLYECLVGTPPYNADSLQALVKQIVDDELVPPRQRNPSIPRALDTIATACLAKAPEERYATAEALADDLARYLRNEAITARPDGWASRFARRVRRNPAPYTAALVAVGALGVAAAFVAVRAARERGSLAATFDTARQITADAPVQALGLFAAVQQRDPNYPGLADALAEARAQAGRQERRAQERKAASFLAKAEAARDRFASAEAGDAREAAWYQAWGFYTAARESLADGADSAPSERASAGLAELAWLRLQESERAGDHEGAARYEALLREHGSEQFARELDGAGTVTLQTIPAGARVRCHPCIDPDGDGRLALGEPTELGVTPLEQRPLARGSYVLVIEAEGRASVRYPIWIERCEDDVVAQGIPLPSADTADEYWCYVPGGESVLGGDPGAPTSGPRRRTWVDGFWLARDEVTVGEYAAFLQSLLDESGFSDDEVTARCPRRMPEDGHIWVVEEGALVPVTNDRIGRRWPIFGVSWDDAQAYCAWRSMRDGVAVRLPTADEWERAARGADGRAYVWGDGFDWDWTVGGGSSVHGERQRPRNVGGEPKDRSVFGVRGMAGNVAEWCADLEAPGIRAARGGGYGIHRATDFRAAHPHGESPLLPNVMRGFRLARDG